MKFRSILLAHLIPLAALATECSDTAETDLRHCTSDLNKAHTEHDACEGSLARVTSQKEEFQNQKELERTARQDAESDARECHKTVAADEASIQTLEAGLKAADAEHKKCLQEQLDTKKAHDKCESDQTQAAAVCAQDFRVHKQAADHAQLLCTRAEAAAKSFCDRQDADAKKQAEHWKTVHEQELARANAKREHDVTNAENNVKNEVGKRETLEVHFKDAKTKCDSDKAALEKKADDDRKLAQDNLKKQGEEAEKQAEQHAAEKTKWAEANTQLQADADAAADDCKLAQDDLSQQGEDAEKQFQADLAKATADCKDLKLVDEELAKVTHECASDKADLQKEAEDAATNAAAELAHVKNACEHNLDQEVEFKNKVVEVENRCKEELKIAENHIARDTAAWDKKFDLVNRALEHAKEVDAERISMAQERAANAEKKVKELEEELSKAMAASGPKPSKCGLAVITSVLYPAKRIRHFGNTGKIAMLSDDDENVQDSWFYVRDCEHTANQCGENRCVSLESFNDPFFFLRHNGFEINLQAWEDRDLYKKNSSFCMKQSWQVVSFESVDYPDRFITFGEQYNLKISKLTGGRYSDAERASEYNIEYLPCNARRQLSLRGGSTENALIGDLSLGASLAMN